MLCVFAWGKVDGCVIVVGDGHHRFRNFDMGSQGKIITFSFVVSEKGRVVRASGQGI